MDRLWSPWRYRYVSSAPVTGECLFCEKAASANDQENADRENLVVLRAEHNFVLLNLYPYTSGHLMIVPYAHVATLDEASPAALSEMMLLAARAERAFRAEYNAAGVNLGMNLGKAAGAGVVGHIHMHVLPRWVADANFMTVVGETRVLPESLEVTWEKLKKAYVE
jgi:ATP adenylyltransferase